MTIFSPMLPPSLLSHEPSWCETNNCQCPCHSCSDDRWWDNVPFIVFALLVGMGFILWIFLTLATWIVPDDPQTTFVGVLGSEWHGLIGLLHRIW
jgi:hypothetical protein